MNRRALLASLAGTAAADTKHRCEDSSVNLGGVAVWNDGDPYNPVLSGYPYLRLMLCEKCNRLWVKRKPEEKK